MMTLGELIEMLDALCDEVGEDVPVYITPDNQQGDCQWGIASADEYDGIVALSMTPDTV